MIKLLFKVSVIGILFILTSLVEGQDIPSETEVHNFFNGKNILVTYHEGEVINGTYYFLEIRYCLNRRYSLYGRSVKQTVLGKEQISNWQETGNWKVITKDGLVGLYYLDDNGNESHTPVYKLNDNIFIKEGVTIQEQGQANCY